MFTSLLNRVLILRRGAVLVLMLSLPLVATAGGPPYGIPSGVMPWEYHKYYKGYSEPFGPSRHTAPPARVAQSPGKYTVLTARVPYPHAAEDPTAVVLMAHVPEAAGIWLQDRPTQQKSTVRYFLSPPLTPGYRYAYSIRVAWKEDDKWVAQTIEVPVEAGEVRCFYIAHVDQARDLAEITANLEKLPVAEQKAALLQKNCPVQSDKTLGSMGVPVKLTIKGETVFLCCEGCTKKATNAAEQTLERVMKLRKEAGVHKPAG